MIKKAFILLITLSLTFVFTACGDIGSTTNESTSIAETTKQQAKEVSIMEMYDLMESNIVAAKEEYEDTPYIFYVERVQEIHTSYILATIVEEPIKDKWDLEYYKYTLTNVRIYFDPDHLDDFKDIRVGSEITIEGYAEFFDTSQKDNINKKEGSLRIVDAVIAK